jgi:hypothetical protein
MKHSVLAACALLLAASGLQAQTPRHLTAEVVSADLQTRLLVIKNPDGRVETVKLDDNVTDLAGIGSGDRVLLTLRGEPGMDRVSALVKSAAPASPTVAVVAPAIVAQNSANVSESPGLRTAYADKVALLAQQAGRVDLLWGQFESSCSPRVSDAYANARKWMSLWDNAAQSDLSGGTCRELYDQIILEGSKVNAGMAAAEDSVHGQLLPGTERDIRRQNLMDWDGWSKTAPKRLQEP